MGYYLFYTTNTKRRSMTKRMKETPSYSSPKGGTRGCLCKDGKRYSRECCDGTLRGQGVGSVTGDGT
jgi:hypothetical protein